MPCMPVAYIVVAAKLPFVCIVSHPQPPSECACNLIPLLHISPFVYWRYIGCPTLPNPAKDLGGKHEMPFMLPIVVSKAANRVLFCSHLKKCAIQAPLCINTLYYRCWHIFYNSLLLARATSSVPTRQRQNFEVFMYVGFRFNPDNTNMANGR